MDCFPILDLSSKTEMGEAQETIQVDYDSGSYIEFEGEVYDLVVVGAGLSGLAAASFFRKEAGPEARILVLDNCDDFGGHATRNEFRSGGRTLLINGGTINIEDCFK